jgi:drug/metabolite transporter (DMT)-like permease
MELGLTTHPFMSRLRHGMSGKALLAITFWGASFVFTRIALESFGPFGLVASRLVAGSGLLYITLRTRGGDLRFPEREIPLVIFLGLVLGTHLLLQAYGLQYTSAMNTGWIIGFNPVTIAIGAQLLGRQRLTGKGWMGVLVGTLGVLMVTIQSPPDFSHARLGDMLQIVSCFTWTIYTLTAVGLVGRMGALRVTTGTMLVATVVASGACLHFGILDGTLTAAALGSMLFLGFACSGIAYVLWLKGQQEHGPSRVASLLYLEPLVTLVTAAIFLHEPITPNAVMGGLTVLGGVWLVTHGSRLPRSDPAST